MLDHSGLLGDIYLRRDGDLLHFGNRVMDLAFSLETGNWVRWFDHALARHCIAAQDPSLPTVLLRVGGKRAETGLVRDSRAAVLEGEQTVGSNAQYEAHTAVCLDREVRLEITTREGDWLLTTIYRLHPGNETLCRDLRVRYEGPNEVLLRDVRLVAPCLIVGNESDTTIEAPGYPVVAHYPLTDIPPGQWDGLDSRPLCGTDRVQHSVDVPGSMVGLVALDNPQALRGVMSWPYSASEFAQVDLVKEPRGVTLVHWLFLVDRFTAGRALEAGRQYLRLYHAPWEEALRGFQAWYETVGLSVPRDRPAWAIGTAIYEVHIGRAPFLDGVDYTPYPTMRDLLADLPRIADLGFEVIQIMPHFPFCGYTVHDYHDIDQQYGDAAALRAVVQAAHQMGLRVILDVVLHGCVDREIVQWDMATLGAHYDFIFNEWLSAAHERSPYRDAHAEWFMRDEAGDTARTYTWAFGLANAGFQDFLIGVLQGYVEDLDVDGFRFDAPTWNCMPNWARGLPYRPSAAYYGARTLFERARHALKRIHPDLLFYTEPSGPLFRHTMDLTYNYDEEWLSGSLLDVVSPRGYAGSDTYDGRRLSAGDVARWLHDHRLALPPGSETVHHLDSHDTFWWGEKAQFRREAFGIQASRALFALYACLDGGIMVYTGAESGSEDFYRRLLRLRRASSALRYGQCDTQAIVCEDDRVLPLLRTSGNEHAIVLVNLSDASRHVTLSVPLRRLRMAAADCTAAVDLLNDERIPYAPGVTAGERLSVAVDLPAYGVRILQVGSSERPCCE